MVEELDESGVRGERKYGLMITEYLLLGPQHVAIRTTTVAMM